MQTYWLEGREDMPEFALTDVYDWLFSFDDFTL